MNPSSGVLLLTSASAEFFKLSLHAKHISGKHVLYGEPQILLHALLHISVVHNSSGLSYFTSQTSWQVEEHLSRSWGWCTYQWYTTIFQLTVDFQDFTKHFLSLEKLNSYSEFIFTAKLFLKKRKEEKSVDNGFFNFRILRFLGILGKRQSMFLALNAISFLRILMKNSS